MSRLRKASYYAWSVVELLSGVRHPLAMIRLFISGRLPRNGIMRLRKSKLKYRIRSKMDAWSVKEAVIDRFYERCGIRIQKDWKIVDIGAAIGEFTIYAARKAKAGKVFAFEPNPESMGLLKENLALNRIKNVVLNQCGVWSEAARMRFDNSLGEPLQAISVLTDTDKTADCSFDVITLNDVVEHVVRDAVDLLKLDCEGAEYAILAAASDETLQKIRCISMEYHNLDLKQSYQWLMDFLASKDFNVKHVPNAVHSNIGYLYATKQAHPNRNRNANSKDQK